MLAGEVFLLKRMEDFPLLTFWPDQLQYLLRQKVIIVALVEVAFAKIIKSSATNK